MDNKDKILGRIKKLLAMANDVGSPEEAVIAARRARSMMDKYDIQKHEVEQFSDKSKFGKVKFGKEYKYMPVWINILSVAVAEWNDCIGRLDCEWKSNGNRKYIQFLGLEADAITARVMMEYLQDTVIRLAKAQGYGSNARMLTSFKLGASRELCSRIHKIIKERQKEIKTSTGTDLVVIKKQLVEKEFGATNYSKANVKIGDGGAYCQGIEAGSKINLHSQVGNSKQGKLS